MKSYLDEAGRLALGGGDATGGIFVEPTVVDGVTRTSRLFREEMFGPVLSVTTFETVAQAVALANDTPYGLAASVYTGSLRNAIRLSREIRAGVVTVNCFGEGDVDHALRRLQGVGLRRARQVDLRPRPVHRAQDDLDRRLRPP